MAGIAITRRELTASELRTAAGKTKDARAARRMLAIALVLEGADRATAAETCGMDRQTLRDWVHRYNAEGLAGMVNRTVPQRPRRLAPEQLATLAAWVEAGPDRARDGVVRWRRRDLQARIEAEFGVTLHERSAGQATGGTRFSAAVCASAAPEVGPASPGSVQKNFPEAVAAAIPARARDKPLEIWFQDEARVGQRGTLTRIWARRGTRPRAPRDTRYQWAYVFGAVCPARGTAAGLVLPFVNTAAMNAHLAEIARTVAPGAHAVLILDGAGWHGSAALAVPDNLSLLTLPPYSPELNPVENVWASLRANKRAITVFNNYEEIVDACCTAWNFFANDPKTISSIATRTWAQVS